MSSGLIRPDGAAVAHARAGQWWVYPLGGGAPKLVPGLDSADVLRWNPNGTALWLATPGNRHVETADVASGRRTLLTTVDLSADQQVFNVGGLTLADDPKVYAYGASSSSSLLFTIQGVR